MMREQRALPIRSAGCTSPTLAMRPRSSGPTLPKPAGLERCHPLEYGGMRFAPIDYGTLAHEISSRGRHIHLNSFGAGLTWRGVTTRPGIATHVPAHIRGGGVRERPRLQARLGRARVNQETVGTERGQGTRARPDGGGLASGRPHPACPRRTRSPRHHLRRRQLTALAALERRLAQPIAVLSRVLPATPSPPAAPRRPGFRAFLGQKNSAFTFKRRAGVHGASVG